MAGRPLSNTQRGSKPWQNAAGESFNGKFRDEGLSLESVRNRIDAKIEIDVWQRHYYGTRPHSRLGYPTRGEFSSAEI